MARNEIGALRAQIEAKDERLKLAHENAESAKAEFAKYKLEIEQFESVVLDERARAKAELEQLKRAAEERVSRAPSISPKPILPPQPPDQSISGSVHSYKLGRVLSDVSTATGG